MAGVEFRPPVNVDIPGLRSSRAIRIPSNTRIRCSSNNCSTLRPGPALRRIHHADVDDCPSTSPCISSGSSALSARIEISGLAPCIGGTQRNGCSSAGRCGHRRPSISAGNPLGRPTSWRACSTVRNQCRGVALKLAPGRRQCGACLVANEQRATELLFQACECACSPSTGSRAGARGRNEIAGRHHGQERPASSVSMVRCR